MIKEEMTLPEITYGGIKGTGAISTLENDVLLPYCVGYVPDSMIAESNYYSISQYIQQYASGYYNTHAVKIINQQLKGVPFAYAFTSASSDGTFFQLKDESWSKSGLIGSNTSGLISEFDTDVLKDGIFTASFPFSVKWYVQLINKGTGKILNDRNGNTAFTLDTIEEIINFNFSKTVDQTVLGFRAIFPITSEMLQNSENGIMEYETDVTYSEGGTTYDCTAHYYIIIETFTNNTLRRGLQASISICDNLRIAAKDNNQNLNRNNVFYNAQGVSGISYIRSRTNPQIEELIAYSREWFSKPFDDAVLLWLFNNSSRVMTSIFSGLTMTDIKIIICTAYPIYKIGDNFYVAEFTDDYYITGNLIPYDQAKEWQKNINSDTNDFDFSDIPEPTPPGPEPEPEGDSHSLGTISVNAGFGGVHHVAVNGAGMTSIFEEMNTLPTLLQSIKQYFSENGNINDYIYSAKIFPVWFTGGQSGNRLQIGYDVANTISIASGIQDISRVQVYSGVSIQCRKLSDKEFLNYAPYTQLFLKVPYCAEIEIPIDICAGNTVDITFCVDVLTGMMGVYAVCSGKIVGITSAKIGVDILRSSIDSAAYGKNKVNALFSGITAGIGGLASALTGNAAGIVGSVSGLANSAIQSGSTKAYTSIDGFAGDLSGAIDTTDCYIRYVYSVPEIPEGLGNAQGFIDYKYKKISACSGFTKCINPVVNVNCTEAEKQEIKKLLESGIYI